MLKICRNSAASFAAVSLLRKSSSISMAASRSNTSRCSSAPSSGTAIINNKCTGAPSALAKSTPCGTTIAANAARFTALLLPCGMAMPSPMPVVERRSLSKIACLNFFLSSKLPLFASSSTICPMASALSCGFLPRAMLSFCNNSEILIENTSFLNIPHE